MTTLKQLLDELAEQFTIAELEYGHGTDNPWDEAVALSLGWLRWADDATNLGRDVPPADLTQIKALAHRRVAQRVPVPLLLGHTHFAGIEFDVTPGVMIPRSPFAELIQGGFQPWLATPPGRILDLCSGGGCIGIACALHWPQAEVVLADLESAACELARVNVIKHGLTERVTVVQSNLFEHLEDRFDLILSNPPYVPSDDSRARGYEFRHEPDNAYDGGVDGMVLVRRLLAESSDYLAPQASLFVEVGQYRPELEAHYPLLPFTWPEFVAGGEGVFLLAAKELAEHTA